MKKIKTLLVTALINFLFISTLFAAESQIAKEMKNAFKTYAGLSELEKRGFKLETLDYAESAQDVYNILLPYMVQDGVPLDNAIVFRSGYSTYSFKQHYNVHFTDDYGTKQQLQKKGYKENEILPYYSKGENIYRGGKFSWEKVTLYNRFRWNSKPLPPVVEDKFIYFFPQFYTEKFFPDYWEQAASKDFIIIDLRMDEDGDYPISLFLDHLDKVNYKGQLILLIDSSSYTGEWLLSYRMTKWQNGKEVPRKFKYITIGQNTLGMSNFTGQWKRYQNDDFTIWGVREQVNQWKTYDEGVGIMPQIWAETPKDIIKTLEYLMETTDIGRTTKAFINYVYNIENDYIINEPDALLKINDEKEFFEKFSDFVEIQSKIYKKTAENPAIHDTVHYEYLYDKLHINNKNMSADEYNGALNQIYENIFLKNGNIKNYVGAEVNLDILYAKEPAHKYTEKEIQNLYNTLGIKMVDIPGKNIQMMNTELTQKVFEKIMGYNPSTFKNPDNPVESVTDTEFFYFCNKLSEKFGYTPVYALDGEYDTSKWKTSVFSADKVIFTQNLQADGFRAPTRAEWSFAAKGGEDYEYAGSNNIDEVAWYSGNSGNKTHSVAQKKPNGYGLYDMSGNVSEFYWFRIYEKSDRLFPSRSFIGGNYTPLDDGTSNEKYCSVKLSYDGGNIIGSMHGYRIVRSTPAKQLPALSKKEVQKTQNEIKKNMVELTETGIKVLKTEVTQKMYISIMEDNPSFNKGYDNPVVNVSYFDAIYYCNMLSTKLGYTPVYSVYGETDITKWKYVPDRNNWINGNIIQNPDANGFRLPSYDEWNYLSKNANNLGLLNIEGKVSEWLWGVHKDNRDLVYAGGMEYSPYSPNNQYDDIGFRLVQTDFNNKKNASDKGKTVKVKNLTFTMNEISSKKILMLNTKVTRELYECVMGYAPDSFSSKKEEPVYYVNWYNAIYFCNKLSEMCGLTPVYSFNGKTETSKWNYKPTDGTHDLSAWDRTNQIKADVQQNPKASGFRLPTLDEWLYAANRLDVNDMVTTVREWVWDKPEQDNLRYVCSGTGEDEHSGFLAEVDFNIVGFRIVCSDSTKF